MKTKPMDDLRAVMERLVCEGDGTAETKEFVALTRCAAAALEARDKDVDLRNPDPKASLLLVLALAHHWVALGYANTGTDDRVCDALCEEANTALAGATKHLGISERDAVEPILSHAIQMRMDADNREDHEVWSVGQGLEIVQHIYDERGETAAAPLLDAWLDLAWAISQENPENAKYFGGAAIKTLQGLTVRKDGAK